VQSAANFPGLVLDGVTRHAYIDRTEAERNLDTVSFAYLQHNQSVGALPTDYMSGLVELLHVPHGWFEGIAVYSQLIGPISLALQLTDEQQRAIIYDPILLEALAHFLSLRVTWLSSQVATLAENTIICLDEPFLDACQSPFFPLEWERCMELLDIVFAGVQGCCGLTAGAVGSSHTKHNPFNLESLLQTTVEVLCFDVAYRSDVFLHMVPLLSGFLKRSGTLVWGIVPVDAETVQHETVDTLTRRFQKLLRKTEEAGLPHDVILPSLFISTSGSLTHLPVQLAERALQLCTELSLRIRLIYGLAST
jgi:hypothetical protein